MKRNSDRLNHALHNEKVCDYLELKEDFSDWIITTAFYAALQFVTYRIFPFEVPSIEGKKTSINSIDDYHRYKGDRKITKHELLSDLVDTKIKEVSADYDWLKDMSMNARYSNYKQDRLIATKARALLKRIKSKCPA